MPLVLLVWCPCGRDGFVEGRKHLVFRIAEPGIRFARDLDGQVVLRPQEIKLFLGIHGQPGGYVVRFLIWHEPH